MATLSRLHGSPGLCRRKSGLSRSWSHRLRVVVRGSASEALDDALKTPEKNAVLEQMLENQRRRIALRSEMAALRREAKAGGPSVGPAWWEVDCPPNMINVQTRQQLASEIEDACAAGKLVVVNFFSPECYACKSMQPKLRQIAQAAPDSILFLKVNGFIEDLREYCEEEGINKIPFFHFYKDGERVAAFTANMQPDKLKLLRAQIALYSGGGSCCGSTTDSQ